ncbi:hypothetical protein [Rhodococcus sp. HNM0569]|uniref:hypothetical protein n=1 Tax=Rhodococcus sp. HNM0569 TaxID=2716340 RepID=UPI00146D561D|nr:hypothetical protein [Rhodococcus sp. HNM0569]NLU83244.1 hypothetical protein [Rhodococcus sp. HNM0569]
MWFGLASIALAGAVALLYFDRQRRDQSGRIREIWAKAQGYDYKGEQPNLPAQFHRAAMSKQEYQSAYDVVRGVRRGERFLLFDLRDIATIVAVQRPVGSSVDIDLRLKSTPPPKDADLELLGAIGPRVVFTTDLEIARRACDQRMVAFTESIPDDVNMLWTEGRWTLGSLPVSSTGRDWDAAIETVARLSGILHVLPPSAPPRGRTAMHDPGRPTPSSIPRVEDDDERPRRRPAAGPRRPRPDDEPPRRRPEPRPEERPAPQPRERGQDLRARDPHADETRSMPGPQRGGRAPGGRPPGPTARAASPIPRSPAPGTRPAGVQQRRPEFVDDPARPPTGGFDLGR